QMEWNNPPEGRRVSSFDQLFRTALTGVVAALLAAAPTWGPNPERDDGPLADALFKIANEFQNLWHQHSQSLRLSVLETVSDDGENIHILLDLLRLKVRYDRIAWRMRPLALAHEALCESGYDDLAARWRSRIAEKTVELSDELLKELNERETRYGVKLRTVRD